MTTLAPRILVIDDDYTLCRSIQRILAPVYDVTCATTRDEALGALSSRPYDAILSDVHVAGFNGIDLVETIVSHDPRYFGSVLFMSGAALSESQQEQIQRQEHTLIAKPFTPAELLKALSRIAPPRSGRDAA